MTGPVDLAPSWPLDWFQHSLDNVEEPWCSVDFAPAFARWMQPDADLSQFTPWAAFACSCYANGEKAAAPQKVLDELRKVRADALELLGKIRSLDTLLTTGEGQNKPREYLVARALIRDEIGGAEAVQETRSSLAQLADAMLPAIDHIEMKRAELGGGEGSRRLGLAAFVSILAPLWISMTGRPASTERRRDGNGSGVGEYADSPDFVLFAVDVATIGHKEDARVAIPSRGQIEVVKPA